MRVTTNALIRNYKGGLSKATSNMTNAMQHVMTQRSFNSVAEDPAAAARSSQLWRKYLQNQDHKSMLKDVQDRQDSQEDALTQVYKAAVTIGKEYSVAALNSTNGEDVRATYATAIRQYQHDMVMSMNISYEDSFLFAGSNGKTPPFEMDSDGDLTYRGIKVSTTDPGELEKLKKMSAETQYVDLGFGLSLDTSSGVSQVISSSAFDTSLPGIKALGYGTDGDGDSKNLIDLAGQLADILEADTFDSDRYGQLMDKFQDLTSGVLSQVTELGIKSEFLETTESRLTNTNINLQEQIHTVEGVDMAEAITTFSWAQYAYNAALKVGTNLLSPSFIDFMR